MRRTKLRSLQNFTLSALLFVSTQASTGQAFGADEEEAGLYTRASFGPGWIQLATSVTNPVSGTGPSGLVAIGYAPGGLHNTVFGIAAHVINAQTKSPGAKLRVFDRQTGSYSYVQATQIGSVGGGAFIEHFPAGSYGWNLGALVGPTKFGAVRDDIPRREAVSTSIGVWGWAGYDARVVSHFRTGIVAMAMVGWPARVSDETARDLDVRARCGSLSLMVSLTWL